MGQEGNLSHSIVLMIDEATYREGTLWTLLPICERLVLIGGSGWCCFTVDYYVRGKHCGRNTIDLSRFPAGLLMTYIVPSWIAAKACYDLGGPFDIFIGISVNGGIAGVISRTLRLVRRAVYWANDWFPVNSPQIDGWGRYVRRILFTLLDRIATELCDATWNFTERIQQARLTWWQGLKVPVRRESQVLYPVLRAAMRPPEVRSLLAERHGVAFLGTISAGQNLEIAMESLAQLRSEGLPLTLEIIGDSAYVAQLRDCARRLGIEEATIFHGFILTADRRVSEIYEGCFCGINLAQGGPSMYTHYGPTTKIISYIEHGLPVVTSTTTSIADQIAMSQSGIILHELTNDKLTNALRLLATNEMVFRQIQKNALALARTYSSPEKLLAALDEVLGFQSVGEKL